MGEPKLWSKLGIVDVDHVAISVVRIKDILPLLHAMGWKGGERIFEQPELGRNLTSLARSKGEVKLEILEPPDRDSYLWDFLQKYGPSVRIQHHITYYVKDLKKAELVLKKMGVRLFYARPGEFFIHPDSAGTLIQFFPERTRVRMLIFRARFIWHRYGNRVLFALAVLDVAERIVRLLRKLRD